MAAVAEFPLEPSFSDDAGVLPSEHPAGALNVQSESAEAKKWGANEMECRRTRVLVVALAGWEAFDFCTGTAPKKSDRKKSEAPPSATAGRQDLFRETL